MKKIATLLLFLILFFYSKNLINAQAITPPFNANSIWNKPIDANPQVAPNSAQMIEYLMSAYSSLWVDGVDGFWSVPVYTSNANTPLQKICDTTSAWPCMSWPVPTNTIPTPDDDGKIALVDPIAQKVFSGWQFKPGTFGGGQWTIGGGAFGWSYTSSYGDGIHVWGNGLSGGRVSLWNYYAGLFYPEEIRQGHIDHALHINIPAIRARQGYSSGGFVWPAFHSDGQSTDPNAIPVGSHFQLNPSVDVDALNLSPGAKVIAKALQKYGAWLGDTGSLTTINATEYLTGTASNPVLDSSPWSGVLTANSFLNVFPMDKMRILVTNPADYYTEGSTPSPTISPTLPPTLSPSPSPTPVIIPGDANGDGFVNNLDYLIWKGNYNKVTAKGYSDGDFNLDQKVDGKDYIIWLIHY